VVRGGIVDKACVTSMMEECNIHGLREMAVYVCWGGVLHEGTNGVMTYAGGNSRCIWVYDNMRYGDVLKLVEHAMGVVSKEVNVWYTMKFDRRMFLPLENDGDIRSMMRGNDGHAYLYVTAKEVPAGPRRESGEVDEAGGVRQDEGFQRQPSGDMGVQWLGSMGVVPEKGEASRHGDGGAAGEHMGR